MLNFVEKGRCCLVAVTLAASTWTAQAQDASAVLMYSGADREQFLIEGAKKEGQVVFYSAMIVNQALRPLAEAFQAKYPFIEMTYWRGGIEDIIAKVVAESQAENVMSDLVEGNGVGEALVGANLAQKYLSPELQNFPEAVRDPAQFWTPTRLSYYSIAYNTELVPADAVPRSYEDLLDPRWKGKLAWRVGDPNGAQLFITNLLVAWGEEKANAYFEKLKEQGVVNFGAGSARTLVDRVIAGEHPIALNIFAHHPLISAAQGAPVNSALLGPVPSTASTMVVPKGLKHPHAAMLLSDFILSAEGQKILAGAEYFPARPDVPPLQRLDAVIPETAGVASNFIAPEKQLSFGDEADAIYQKYFR